jgi:hypothetical protein
VSVLIVDGANVVGSVPDGWWRDRADTSYDEIVLVLEGQAKAGVRAGLDAHVRTVHAPRDGDAEIREQARRAVGSGAGVTVVTADRALAANVSPAQVLSPAWLLDRL